MATVRSNPEDMHYDHQLNLHLEGEPARKIRSLFDCCEVDDLEPCFKVKAYEDGKVKYNFSVDRKDDIGPYMNIVCEGHSVSELWEAQVLTIKWVGSKTKIEYEVIAIKSGV